MKYLKRTSDTLLADYLETFGAVLIEGPKWCGKTTSAAQFSKSILQLQDPDIRERALSAADIKPSMLLQGDTPRLIDEWQDIPVLWDAVRTMVDKRQNPGQFILTGSNTVDKGKILHSGTGRIAKMRMLPMSLYESEESTGEVSLEALFRNPQQDIDGARSEQSIEQLIFSACRGGWPAAVLQKNDKNKLLVAKSYLESLCESDISRVDGVNRDRLLTRRILASYARNISTLAQKKSILNDVVAEYGSCSMVTLDAYLEALRRLFAIEDIEPWSPAIRSASTMRRTPKREFIDPSIAVAALGLSPSALETDLKTFGFIFECMCARDLKAYSQALGGRLSFYHDRLGLEADFVLHLDDGRYALIECKLGSREIDLGAEHLLEIKRLVKVHNDTEKQIKLREPDLLIVITGGEMAYTRKDGVKIIPLASLRP